MAQRIRPFSHDPAAVLLLALAAFALAACGGGGEASAPAPVVAVQVAAATQGPLQQWVRAQAVLYPLHQAVITPKISAPVSQFHVNRGDVVQAGELVAELENGDLRAAAQQAEAQLQAAQAAYTTATAGSIPADQKKAELDLTAAQKTFDNAQQIYTSRQRLYREGALPKRDADQAGVDLANAQSAYELAQQHQEAMQSVGHTEELKAAQAQLDSAQAAAAAAEAQLGYSEIHSPIAGVVADRPLYPGELASSSSPLMTIVDLSQVVARVHLPADQAALLQLGDAATLTAPGSDTPLPARVTVISPATDPGSTTLEVWVQGANPGAALRPGTSVVVAALARTLAHALTIPAAALLTDPTGATSVMVVGADGKAHAHDVEVGLRNADRVQILKGVAVGDRVVTVGAYGLADQTQVKIVPADSSDKGEQP